VYSTVNHWFQCELFETRWELGSIFKTKTKIFFYLKHQSSLNQIPNSIYMWNQNHSNLSFRTGAI
jgi:hypothetical protein